MTVRLTQTVATQITSVWPLQRAPTSVDLQTTQVHQPVESQALQLLLQLHSNQTSHKSCHNLETRTGWPSSKQVWQPWVLQQHSSYSSNLGLSEIAQQHNTVTKKSKLPWELHPREFFCTDFFAHWPSIFFSCILTARLFVQSFFCAKLKKIILFIKYLLINF